MSVKFRQLTVKTRLCSPIYSKRQRMAGYGRDRYLKGTIYSGGGYDTLGRRVLPLFHELKHAHGSLSTGIVCLQALLQSNHEPEVPNCSLEQVETAAYGYGLLHRDKICRKGTSPSCNRDGCDVLLTQLPHSLGTNLSPCQDVRTTPFSDCKRP